jgi:hypothetical protein
MTVSLTHTWHYTIGGTWTPIPGESLRGRRVTHNPGGIPCDDCVGSTSFVIAAPAPTKTIRPMMIPGRMVGVRTDRRALA